METVRWGILGTGMIAHKFADGLAAARGTELVAVGSRNADRAKAFAEEKGVRRHHGSYEGLAEDDEIDVVYVATPHPSHYADTHLCLDRGKAVLCEKPFTVNAREAAELVDLAREKQLFLMEGMWSRCIPAVRKVDELLRDGTIGEPRLFQADFGFRTEWDPSSRLLNRALGGGALLDVGCYLVSFASLVMGAEIEDATGYAVIGETGVDEQDVINIRYPGGKLASLACAVRTGTLREAMICGTDGTIRVHDPFFRPERLTVHVSGQGEQVIDMPLEGNGFNYEAEEVASCLREGRLESPLMPLDESVAIMGVLDCLREQWSLTFPSET